MAKKRKQKPAPVAKESKKMLTQEDLDKMSPTEVLQIDIDTIPDGYDIEHENGANAKLVNIEETDKPASEGKTVENQEEKANEKPENTSEESTLEEIKEEEPEAESTVKKLEKKEQENPHQSNRGILFLRMFVKDTNTGKILTRLKKKVFFPSRNLDKPIEPGWYVACVVSEHDTFGEMDVIELDKIKPILWSRRYVKGVHVKYLPEKGIMEIYPSVPRERLAKEAPPCIHTCKLPEGFKPFVKKEADGIRMEDLLGEKEKEALANLGSESADESNGK